MGSGLLHRLAGALVAGWIALALFWMGWMVLAWPGLRADAAAEMVREDAAACARLGLGLDAGAAAFARCAAEFGLARRRHEARRDTAGLP